MFNKGGEAQVKFLFLTGRWNEGLELLQNLYCDELYRYSKPIAKSCGLVFGPHDFDDLWQVILLKIFRYLQGRGFAYDPPLIFLMMRIAKFQIYTWARRPANKRRRDIDDLDGLLSFCEKEDPEELLAVIITCLDSVSVANREVLEMDVQLLFETGEWVTARELAAKLGREVSTVSSQRTRGRRQLRDCLQGKGYADA